MKLKSITSGDVFAMRKCKKPRMSGHFGRTWDYMTLNIDGQNVKGWRDYTWGANIYFPYRESWYAVSGEAEDRNRECRFTALQHTRQNKMLDTTDSADV